MADGTVQNPLNTESSTCMQIASGTVTSNTVHKTKNIAFISYTVTGATIAGTNGTVCQLREGYKPAKQQDICVLTNYAGSLMMNFLTVNTDGTIKTAMGSNTATAIYIRSVPILLT